MDCDVEEPNAHIFLKPTFSQREVVLIPVPRVDEGKCTYCEQERGIGLTRTLSRLRRVQLYMHRASHLQRAGVCGRGYCLGEGIPILLTIPLDVGMVSLYSRGTPLIEGIPQWREHFLELLDKVKEGVNVD